MLREKITLTEMEGVKEARSFFEIILDSISEGVFAVNKEWQITYFNHAAEKITGVSKEEALGRPCYEVFHANICQTDCALKKTIKTGKPVIDLPINIINREGRKIPLSISTAVLRDEKGKVVGGVETFRDLSAVEELKREITKKYTFEDIISKSHEIQKIFEVLPDIAESDATVLIQGPSGSGKELFAKAIHNLSPRHHGPYVVVNCAALPDTLLESELFGYVKGAFTDAKHDKPGRFALAHKGTIFLDEIGDISPAMQVKLLRVLQEKEFEPLGATKSVKVDVRVICATNKDLAKLVAEGRFREDLYYRINVIKIELPPLSKRREDIPLLIDHFIHRLNAKMNKNIIGVSDEVLEFLMKYEFPGNVRELENIIEHAFILCRGSVIQLEHLPREVIETVRKPVQIPTEKELSLEALEIKAIKTALQKHRGHRGRAAQELGIDKSTLWRKMKRYGLL
ncbi:MAG TPA: PAS domain-containing protein [Candidatus Desulfofervidus auxilii]|uniref:PAS domain-containing protein n=1 Tax=Desulfofervidus auxilii TaxID=1621989 RepID=A0A7C0U3L4_DESA2|nr:PAS domain-containing protein [Candidatus Desulfofervidus auxilii]